MTHAPGTPIRVEMTKWGDRPHWAFEGVFLGTDPHGDWLGFPVGTRYTRPGMDFFSTFAAVTLVPADGPLGTAHLAAFNDENAGAAVYVDVATPATWDGTVLRSVDLDLDVVRRHDGSVYLDDEDEFAEHRVTYGYPDDVVAIAEKSAADVLAAVRTGATPYDGHGHAWLARVPTPR